MSPVAQRRVRNMPSAPSSYWKAHTAAHDGAVLSCLAVALVSFAARRPRLAQHDPACARCLHWDSWADALCAIARRDPDFAHEVATSLASDRPAPLALQSARDASDSLSAIGFEHPAWGRTYCMLRCLPSSKRTRPLTSLVEGSARRPKPLTTFAIGPSSIRETNAPRWTRTLGLMLRAHHASHVGVTALPSHLVAQNFACPCH